MTRIHDAMFRGESEKAFALLREGLLDTNDYQQIPQLSVADDQIVWGRSPVRIDIAGGWTDTPPYCLMEGVMSSTWPSSSMVSPHCKPMCAPVRSPVSCCVASTWVPWRW